MSAATLYNQLQPPCSLPHSQLQLYLPVLLLSFLRIAERERENQHERERHTHLVEVVCVLSLVLCRYINGSLNALGNVVAALANKSSHKGVRPQFIPWRDSKLTRLLHDALAGQTRTMLLISARPDDDSVQDTQAAKPAHCPAVCVVHSL